jgi:hypothetical protein
MNKALHLIALSAATLAVATPANADTFVVPHPGTPVSVRAGAAQALNPQPIPPGHVLTMPFTRTLDTHALNTQPIPPGHPLSASVGSTFSTLVDPSSRSGRRGRGGDTSGHRKSHSIHTGWDVSKNTKS